MENNIILILSVLVGSFLGYFFKNNQKINQAILVLSAGFLLAICLFEIFPSIFHEHSHTTGFYVLIGVIIQIILESLTKGVEHGHMHFKQLKSIPIPLILGLFVHAFLEGIPTNHAHEHHKVMLWAISIHNLPIAMMLSSQLFNSQLSNKQSWFIIILFSLMSPIGNLFGTIIPVEYFTISSAIVAGIFLHISSLIIFESNENHKLNFQKLLYVIIGVTLAWFSIAFTH